MNSLTLSEMLDTMDIPKLRRDTTSKSNVAWLLRNLLVNNANNPHVHNAIKLLREMQ